MNIKDRKYFIKNLKQFIHLRKDISLDLATIAKETKIPKQMLKKIELNEFDKLPPDPVGLSFLNQYVKIIRQKSLKLDCITNINAENIRSSSLFNLKAWREFYREHEAME